MNENRKPTILYVDDDNRDLKLVEAILSPQGYDLRFSESAEDALKQISVEIPKLILLDIDMPGMSGLEALKTLLNDKSMRSSIVVILSGYRDAGNIKAAMELGATAYIQKPIDRVGLLGVIQAILGSQLRPVQKI